MTSPIVELPSLRGAQPLLPPPSARSTLLTVIGELLKDNDAAVWTTALLRVLGGLGIEDHAARQVLARAAKAGWVERERHGRSVCWRLAPHGRALVDEGVRRSDAYLAAEDDWDGEWLVANVTVPQSIRTTRKRLYGGLHWLGMGSPTPGLWLSPHTERLEDLRDLITSLELTETTLTVVGTAGGIGMSEQVIVDRSWDLSDLTERYRQLLDQEESAPDPDGPDLLLLSFLDLLNLQQRFMRLDPLLPSRLLPQWIGPGRRSALPSSTRGMDQRRAPALLEDRRRVRLSRGGRRVVPGGGPPHEVVPRVYASGE